MFVLQNEPMDDRTVPKKAYVRTKTRVKPPPAKIIVKRDVNNRKILLDEDNMIKIDDNDEENERNSSVPLIRSRRSLKMFHMFSPNHLSPMSVTNAENYNEKEHKEWVKPLFSSIVYRLPVSHPSPADFIMQQNDNLHNLSNKNKHI